MNLQEIRQKYPQYDDLSDEQLAKGMHGKFYSDMPFEDFSQKIGMPEVPERELSADQQQEIAARQKAYEDKYDGAWQESNLTRKPAAFVQGVASATPFNEELASGLEKVAPSLFSADTRPVQPKDVAERALEKVGDYGFSGAQLMTGGNLLKAGGLLGKGAGKTSKIAQALLSGSPKTAVLTAAGGGALEGYANPDNAVGKIAANLIGGSAVNLARPSVWANAVKTTPKASGLRNIVEDTDSLKMLRRGMKASDDVAKDVFDKVPTVENELNAEARTALDKALFRNIDTKKMVSNQGEAYQRALTRQAAEKTFAVGEDRVKNPTIFQKNAAEKALKEADSLTNYPRGTIAHANRIKQSLNAMELKAVAQQKSRAEIEQLRALQKHINGTLRANSSIKLYDDRFSKAMAASEALERGKTFTTSALKNGVPVKTPLERQAFTQGFAEKVIADAKGGNLAKEIRKNETIFKNILPKKRYDSLLKEADRIDLDYSRLNKLSGNAENKLITPEGTGFFGREQLESKGSIIGTALDKANSFLMSKNNISNAKKLMDASKPQADVLEYPAAAQYLMQGAKAPAEGGYLAGRNLYSRYLLGDDDN